MKLSRIFLGSLIVVAGVSLLIPPATEAKGARLGEEFTISVGERVKVSGTNISLRFVDVLEDERCPTDYQCLVQGNAQISVDLQWKHRPVTSVLLNTFYGATQAEFRTFVVKLVGIEPDRRSDQVIDKAEYRVKMIVTEADDSN